MTIANRSLDFFPCQTRSGVLLQIGLSAGKLLLQSIVNRHGTGSSREIIPQILDELQLFRGGEVEYCQAVSFYDSFIKSRSADGTRRPAATLARPIAQDAIYSHGSPDTKSP
jgi:hypothetical protein